MEFAELAAQVLKRNQSLLMYLRLLKIHLFDCLLLEGAHFLDFGEDEVVIDELVFEAVYG